MVKILFPTDFSDHANEALKFAVKIVNSLDAELHLITSFVETRSTGAMVSLKKAIYENHKRELDYIIHSISDLITSKQLPITSVIEGGVSYVIEKYVAENKMDLIIMGTQGSNSVSNVLFGSTTKKIINNSKIPVLAIPSELSYGPGVPSFLLAIDNQIVESSAAFDIVRSLAISMNRKIDILHISTEKEVIPFDPFIASYLDNAMGEVIILEGNDPDRLIHEYSSLHNIEMLIMIKREHSFFKNLLVQNHTSLELMKTKIPLFIIPE